MHFSYNKTKNKNNSVLLLDFVLFEAHTSLTLNKQTHTCNNVSN